MMMYYDIDGIVRSLEWMVRNEPEWAANRIRASEQNVAEIERLERVVRDITEIAHDGGLIGLSERGALKAIRRMLIPWFNRSDSMNEKRQRLEKRPGESHPMEGLHDA